MKNLRKLLRYLRPYLRQVSLSVLCNLMMAVFTVVSIPAIIPFLQILFNETPTPVAAPAGTGISAWIGSIQYQFAIFLQTHGRETTLIYICVGIVILFFFKNLFRYLALFFMAPVRNGIVRDVRQQVFGHLLVLPIAYFTEERKGDLIARITADVQEIEYSILNVLEAIFREPLIIIGCLAYMIYVSPSLTLFVFVLLLFTGFIIGGISRTLKRESGEAQGLLGRLVSLVEETIGGMRIVKGFNAQAYQSAQFQRHNDAYRNTLTRLLWRRDLSSPLSEFLGIAVVAVLLWYGSRQVFNEMLSGPTFFSFLFAFFNVINPTKVFSAAYYNVQKGLAAVDRVEEILHTPITIQDESNAVAKTDLEMAIEFRNVHFAYTDIEGPVLSDINLTIPKGQTVALVGPSGAGKSTLVDLLFRFYDLQEGQILIDGQDIRKLKIQDLRALIGMVSQQAILFNDTVYNNIAFGMKGVDAAEVERAARIAHAHDFIQATDEGYQTMAGEGGNKFSGGQRQRITLARAILRDPPVLVLDEATSALDSESERLVQDALQTVMAQRTALVIAHRLSTIQHADLIVVIEAGRITEQGTHQELMDRNGSYRRLVEMQAFGGT